MRLMQLSASQGPEECALAVALAWRRLQQEAAAAGVDVEQVECTPGPRAGTYRSMLLALEGPQADALLEAWEGTVQWICASPWRSQHGRRNWFIGVQRCEVPPDLPQGEVRFETCRASGPGGQHVNTTASAVRAVHVPTGLAVRVESERSQHANRRRAAQLLAVRLQQAAQAVQQAAQARRHAQHRNVERGNARRVFVGPEFRPVDTGGRGRTGVNGDDLF